MKKVICFGEILWDNLPNGRLAGGAPMNVAYHLRKLGIDASLISRIGNDKAGNDLVDFISSINLLANNIQIDKQQQTSEVIGTLKANNEIVYDIVIPTAWDFIEWEHNFEAAMAQTSIFLFGSLASRNEVTRNTLMQLLEISKYSAFDVNLRAPHYTEHTIKELLTKADLVKVNENEIEILGTWFTSFKTTEDQAKALLEKFKLQELIVTKGGDGSSYYSVDQHISQKSIPVNVVDTVGSGDSFLAGFLAKKLEGLSIEEAFKFANQLGAFIASKPGACPSYDKDEIIVK